MLHHCMGLSEKAARRGDEHHYWGSEEPPWLLRRARGVNLAAFPEVSRSMAQQARSRPNPATCWYREGYSRALFVM
jgi:hypothetical protein